MSTPDDPVPPQPVDVPLAWPGMSRRQFLKVAGGAGFAAAAIGLGLNDVAAFAAGTSTSSTSTIGSGYVPEQIHLTYGANPSSEVTISWASPQLENEPQVTISPAVGGQTQFDNPTILSYQDGLSGETVYCYHVQLVGLTPGTSYTYTVADPADTTATYTATFTTPQTGRYAYSFTSFGDLATPGTGANYPMAGGTTVESSTYSESQWNAYNAVGYVETLAPVFHLMNGDLCYADKETINGSGSAAPGASKVQPAPEVWRDFALNVQRSATNRPWMPCIGNHEAELDNVSNGYASYNTRFVLPSNGSASFQGSYYAFQVGSVLFISLDANDVCYQGAGAYNVGLVNATDAAGNAIAASAHVYNQYYTGGFTQNADGTLTPGGATPNAQTQWLASTLAAARSNTTIDWIVVQMHQCALSTSTDNGCDAGIRQAWVPLFDQYEVDFVLNGHDHDYERSYPVRGFAPPNAEGQYPGSSSWQGSANASWPSNYFYGTSGPTYKAPNAGANLNTFTPVLAPGEGTGTESDPFDTSLGTVYMVLGGGGTNKRDNTYLTSSQTANVTTFTQIRVGTAFDSGNIAAGTKPLPDAVEPCDWSAMTDTADAYGIAQFSVDPGVPGGNTTITMTYYHATTQTSGAPAYSAYETVYFTRPRSDSPGAATPEFAQPALAVGGTIALAAGALWIQQRRAAGARQAALVHASGPHDN